MNLPRSSLSRVPSEPTSQQDLEAMKRRAWLESGIVAVRPSELMDDLLAKGLINHANKRWGKRYANGGSSGQ